MKFSKIIIIAIISFISLGAVFASDINDLKAPSNFLSDGDGSYYELGFLGTSIEGGVSIEFFTMYNELCSKAAEADEDIEDIELDYSAPSADFVNELFSNGTDDDMVIEATDDEFIYSFTDSTNEMKGYIELASIDGEKYPVSAWVDSNASDDDLNHALESLKEFNQLNNFTLSDPYSIA